MALVKCKHLQITSVCWGGYLSLHPHLMPRSPHLVCCLLPHLEAFACALSEAWRSSFGLLHVLFFIISQVSAAMRFSQSLSVTTYIERPLLSPSFTMI